MKRTIEYSILCGVSVLVSILLILFNMKEFLIFTIILSLVFLLLIFFNVNDNRSDDAIYESTLKKILKTYVAILIESEELPSIRGKNIVKTTSIDNLINAQVEIRKPIYYKKEFDYCTFILLDDNEALVYSLKRNDDIVCAIDNVILEEKINSSKEELLSGIENTTIIKLDNNKVYKISPVKEENKHISDAEFLNMLKSEYMPKFKR